jgi:hypothetical protein
MRNGGSNKDEEAINAGDHEIKHLLLGRGDHEIEFLLLLLTPVREDETGDQESRTRAMVETASTTCCSRQRPYRGHFFEGTFLIFKGTFECL